eukprot:SAG22_NODE_3592_length_1628_cov_1.277305_3_plen_65_part_01
MGVAPYTAWKVGEQARLMRLLESAVARPRFAGKLRIKIASCAGLSPGDTNVSCEFLVGGQKLRTA